MIERQTNNRTIVKNTFFLYFRMMFTMLVTLYTSRVILQMLGVNDYGIYQTVGGVAVILSFISTALSSGSSRFLTYELGKKDEDKLRRTFSTVLAMHLILAFFIFLHSCHFRLKSLSAFFIAGSAHKSVSVIFSLLNSGLIKGIYII